MLRPDEEANRNTYGTDSTPRTILATREISAPTQAAPFLNALGSTASTTAAPVPPPPAKSSPTPAASEPAATSINDGDARARIADMQRTLDRLLAGAGRESVGTTGAATEPSGRTVSVDRATIQHLRQQLDALSAALDRRR